MDTFYLDRPLNFAHRGASYHAPENTLAAFLLAAELGADGIELDAQLSRDREVVILHDLVLETTTDGHGPVVDRTLAELKQLDAGGWFGPDFAGQRIPSLRETFEAVGCQLRINIELKTAGWREGGLAAAVVRLVEEYHLQDRVVVSSFSPLAVWKARHLNRWIRTGLLYAPGSHVFQRRPWTRHWLRPDALHPHYSVVDEHYVHWAKERGYRLHTWTVDDPETMRQLAQQGVDLLITNRPDLLRDVLRTSQSLLLRERE